MSRDISQQLSWIAVDWGSSNLRAWAMDSGNNVLAKSTSDKGMLSLTSVEYEAELSSIITDWLPSQGQITVMVCGMAGAKQGWQEAAYLPIPTPLDRLYQGAVRPPLTNPQLNVYLLPGLSQSASIKESFDVMRGEECQLAGLTATTPHLSGIACLPGTHSKWATLQDGAVTKFATFLTGELYQLLAHHSVLQHSIGSDDLSQPTFKNAFVAAVKQANETPDAFTNYLFELRAQDLLDSTLPSGKARKATLAAKLSGLTIGIELAGVKCLIENTESVSLIGSHMLCQRYALALGTLGYSTQITDGDTAVLAGLTLAYQALTAQSTTR